MVRSRETTSPSGWTARAGAGLDLTTEPLHSASRLVFRGRGHGRPAAAHRRGVQRRRERLDGRLQAPAPVLPRPRLHRRADRQRRARRRRGGGGLGRPLAGAIERTGQPLDVAIEGDGFLQLRRPDGSTGLTRSGALHLGADRRLVTANGDRLVPDIAIPQDVAVDDVSIARDGTVTGGGRTLGRIELRTVPAPAGLLSAGGSVMTPTDASGAPRPATGTLQQGALERSNVDMADAMVELMEAQRSYTLASRAIQTQDQLLEIANGVKR
jgi:flagellar basal-body rod protein FlgG